jgi:hypothetical protein
MAQDGPAKGVTCRGGGIDEAQSRSDIFALLGEGGGFVPGVELGGCEQGIQLLAEGLAFIRGDRRGGVGGQAVGELDEEPGHLVGAIDASV